LQRQRRESIKIQAGTDSSRIHNIIRIVAPAFENNPRRLKQFINLFRLRVYIAAETGLFDYKRTNGTVPSEEGLPADTLAEKQYVSLTLEQLGKFVAINLRWPLLLADMEFAPNLLNDLQKLAFDSKAELATPAARLSRWRHRPDLLSVLASGMPGKLLRATAPNAGMDLTESRWSLENVDFAEIMRVSPRVRRVVGEEAATLIDKSKTPSVQPPVSSPVDSKGAITRVETTYIFGDDLYDDSFSIDTPGGEFLGEMGVGASDVRFPGEPKKYGAFEVWMFDKNDIRTQTKVFMSEFAFNNSELRAKVGQRGYEQLSAVPNQPVVFETETLRMLAVIREMDYGRDASVPPNSYFNRLKLELTVFQKEQVLRYK
jgi:hypothetical protein